jgi:hypothetical protein
MLQKKIIAAVGITLLFGALVTVAAANHSWGGYHWGRTANPLVLNVGDNVGSTWDNVLSIAAADWTTSSVLDLNVVAGQTNSKTCKAVLGRVEVCNSKYGNNGWLGIASISVSGGHILKGTVKLNDTYFNTTKYNTPAWRSLVMCQEIGHTFGLDHQDEVFTNPNLGTCMDYTNDPSTNQHPNQHDYDELVTIYTHLDTVNTAIAALLSGRMGKAKSVGQEIDLNDPSAWGKAVKQDAQGRNSVYERELSRNEKVVTFVVWAD